MILNASPLAGRGGRAGGCLSPGPTAGAEGSPRRLGRARVRHSGRGLVPSLRARHGRLRPRPPGPAPLPPGMHQRSPLVAATALRDNSSLINGPSPRVFCFSARSSPAGPGSLTAASQPRRSPARYLPVPQPPPATKGRPKGSGVRQTVRRRAAAARTGRSVGLVWGGGEQSTHAHSGKGGSWRCSVPRGGRLGPGAVAAALLRRAPGRAGHRLASPRGGGRALQLMWAVESPGAGPSPSSHRTEPALTAPPDSLRRDSPRAPSSLCSSPGLGSGSLPPDSLQAFPGLGSPLESPSIQCDSLECPCCCCGSVASGSGCPDSLQAPLALGNGRRCFGAHHSNPQTHSELSDSLESFGVQHDSLQSLSSLCESFSSSSIEGDSLESLSSLSSGSTSQHSGLEFTSQ